MQVETTLPSQDISMPALQLNEERQITLTGYYEMALNYLRTITSENVTLLKEKIKLSWTQVKNNLQDTYESYCVWIHAYLIMYNWSEEDLEPLLEWVRSKAPGCSVTDFSTTWKNGLTLVALLEGIVPSNQCGCSQYHILNPKHNTQNVELAFSIAKKYLGVSPTLSASQVTSGSVLNEKELIRYVTMLKLAITRRQRVTTAPISMPIDHDPIFHGEPCLVKGMGIISARKNKPARFNVYVRHHDQLDILIEIIGPKGDFCSHRITNRSPRNQSINSSIRSPSDASTPIPSYMNIDLEYEIIGRKVCIIYWPLSAGLHQLNIFWRGRHVAESPYMVIVEDASNNKKVPSTKSKLLLPYKRLNVRPSKSNKQEKKCGQIVSKKLLRLVVIRNGKEIELQEKMPLPYDPEAWCGTPNPACKLVNNSPIDKDVAEPEGSKFRFELSSASTVPSDNSVIDQKSPAVPLDIFAYQAASKLENVFEDKSSIEISEIRECYSGEAQHAKSKSMIAGDISSEAITLLQSDKILKYKKAESLEDLLASCSNEDKCKEVEIPEVELSRDRQKEELLCGCLSHSLEHFSINDYVDEDDDDDEEEDEDDHDVVDFDYDYIDQSFEPSDISANLGEALNEAFHIYGDELETNFHNDDTSILGSQDISTKVHKESSFESFLQSEQEYEEFLTPEANSTHLSGSSNSLVKLRVQEWEDAISKLSITN